MKWMVMAKVCPNKKKKQNSWTFILFHINSPTNGISIRYISTKHQALCFISISINWDFYFLYLFAGDAAALCWRETIELLNHLIWSYFNFNPLSRKQYSSMRLFLGTKTHFVNLFACALFQLCLQNCSLFFDDWMSSFVYPHC